MDIAKIHSQLIKALSDDRVLRDAPMKEFTSFKTGGAAALLLKPADRDQLKSCLAVLSDSGVEYMILGNGSNVLVRDEGYKGAMVHIGQDLGYINIEGTQVTAGSGALLSSTAKAAADRSLTGLEFAAGIPGSIGGGVFMNAGAYDGEMSQVVKEVTVLSMDGGKEYTLSGDEMQFGYRSSRIEKEGGVVLEVKLQLQVGNEEEIRSKMKELAGRRSSKQPLNLPSAGSFFKRPTGKFAGKLIEDAGLKGLSSGGARVSPLHGGFIVNEGGATATDIINLMEVVKHTVYDKFEIWLEPEVRIVGG